MVAGCDSAPVLQPSKHDLDPVAAFVSALIVSHRHGTRFAARNVGLDTFLLQRIPEPFGIVTSVGQHPLRLGHIVQQGSGAGVIADLACGDEEAEWPTIGISQRMELGVHATLGAPDQAPEIPFFRDLYT